ncbi:MAG TPA: MmgE/PrpD family protein [Bacillales bacterium]|nr:MmgE/PrpD family protein [Bacillales bacterium]
MITSQLVKHVIETKMERLPPETIAEAKRSLLNWAGAAIGASKHPSMEKVLKVATLINGEKQATVLGRKERTDVLFAALLNGMSSHIFDFDDTFLDTILHPSAPVFPAILAYAEHYQKSGKDVLEAFIVGCEVEQRLAQALYPSHYWRGWHITGTAGTIGAAAAVAKLQGLDEERFTYAIGLAATEPTGLREMFGTMTKPYHPGKAAMNGLMAALLAESGFTTSKQPLEAPRGYYAVLTDETKLERLTDGWGESWEILNNSYKPFASGVVTHPSIDAAIQLQQNYDLKADDVQSIHLLAHPLVKELTGKKQPETGLEGKFSVYHCVACGFLDGKAGVSQFTDERVKDRDIVTLRDKVEVDISEAIHEDQVRIQVTMKNGDVHERFIEHAIGSVNAPMTNAQLEQKFVDVTATIIDEKRKAALIKLIDDFDSLHDLSSFFQLCVPGDEMTGDETD